MRTIVTALSLAIIFLWGCQGPEGPMGPEGARGDEGPVGLAGPAGEDALAITRDFDLYAHLDTAAIDTAQYDTVEYSNGTRVWRGRIDAELTFSEVARDVLTPAVVDSGAVLLYVRRDTSRREWNLIPAGKIEQRWQGSERDITERGVIDPTFTIVTDTLKVDFAYSTWWWLSDTYFGTKDVGPVPFESMIHSGAELRLVAIPGSVPDERIDLSSYEVVARRYDLPFK